MIAERDILLIRETAERLISHNIGATNAFYANLFAAAPGMRPLFPENMFAQSQKLWDTIMLLVESLDRFEELRPKLHELGQRHAEYGAQPDHYDLVAKTLVHTLETALATIWTAAHRAAWENVLARVNAEMQAGALKASA